MGEPQPDTVARTEGELKLIHQQKMVERCLAIYVLLLCATTALAWGVYLGKGRPELYRPLFASSDRFRDLTNYSDKMAHLSEGGAVLGAGLPVFNYPAPAAYVYAFFLQGFPHHPVRAYLSILAAGLVFGAVLLWKGAQRSTSWWFAAAIITTGVLGFPLVFTADRGNLEGAVGLVLGTGLVLFVMRRFYWAAMCIGVAASIKPFPGLFFLLLLRKKRYRELTIGLAAGACSTLLALSALGPTPIAAYKGLQPGVKRYYSSYIMQIRDREESRFAHSIMDSFKSIAFESVQVYRKHRLNSAEVEAQSTLPDTYIAPAQINTAPTGYSGRFRAVFLLSMLLGAIGILYTILRVFKMPCVNQMILVSVAITLFPPVAAEYTLLHLYVPLGLFLIFLTRDVGTGNVEFAQRHVLTVLSLFAFLLAPITFFGRFAGDVQMLLLLCLLLAAGTYPMPSSIFHEVEPTLVAIGRS
jgi:hypothetical protein